MHTSRILCAAETDSGDFLSAVDSTGGSIDRFVPLSPGYGGRQKTWGPSSATRQLSRSHDNSLAASKTGVISHSSGKSASQKLSSLLNCIERLSWWRCSLSIELNLNGPSKNKIFETDLRIIFLGCDIMPEVRKSKNNFFINYTKYSRPFKKSKISG